MATLSADKVRKFRNTSPAIEYPAINADILYRGSAIGLTSGNARPCTTSDTFVGFTDAKADNSAGAAAAINVAVIPQGEVLLTVTGVTASSDVGTDVYLTDDDTFTLTASAALAIGTVSQWVSSTTCWVFFQGSQLRSI
jgi:hypothetical protein